MEYSLFQYKSGGFQQEAVRRLLAAVNHNLFQPEEWFRWRFEQNPSGKAIIVVANEGEQVVACVIVEKFCVACNGNNILCGCVSNVAKRDGIKSAEAISVLMDMAEQEAKEQGIEILFSFGDEYEQLKDSGIKWNDETIEIEYGIRQVKLFRSIFRLSDLRKSFRPNRCVAYHPDGSESDQLIISDESNTCNLSHDMLKWLVSFTDKEYTIVDNDNVTAIAVVGHRGILKESQLLTAVSKRKDVHPRMYQRFVIDTIKEKTHPDVISFVEDEHLLSDRGIIKRLSQFKYGYKALKVGCDSEELAVAIYRWV